MTGRLVCGGVTARRGRIAGLSPPADGETTGAGESSSSSSEPPLLPPPEAAGVLADAELEIVSTASDHVATTVNEYCVPAVRPDTVHEVAVPEQADVPETLGTAVTAYDDTVSPDRVGTVQLRLAAPVALVALRNGSGSEKLSIVKFKVPEPDADPSETVRENESTGSSPVSRGLIAVIFGT